MVSKGAFRLLACMGQPVGIQGLQEFDVRSHSCIEVPLDCVGVISITAIVTPVCVRVDSAIHWITQWVLLLFIRWILIYLVDSVIHL